MRSPRPPESRRLASPPRALLFPLLVLFACLPGLLPAQTVTWRAAMSQKSDWYATPEARALAANVAAYQTTHGGWPKNTDFTAPPTAEFLAQTAMDRRAATIDNQATTTPLRFLARVISAAPADPASVAPLLASFQRGVDYLLAAQYDNGGWPQYYPLQKGYYTRITYNDGAMVNVLVLLRDIARGEERYAFVDAARRERAAAAVAKGVECILRTQVRDAEGRPTVWCAQHDENTFAPAAARAFEPASLSGAESVGVTRFLMSLEEPSPEIIAAVEGALAWFEHTKITGYRFETFTDAEGRIDRRLVPDSDPAAPPLWARFHELGTYRPLFIGRDREIHYDHAEIERERRGGYVYYGSWADELLREDAPRWRARFAARRAGAPTIFLIGDSTMADKPNLAHPERGWGQLLPEFVRPPARVDNHAKNGRSTKSFIDEGRWDAVLAKLRAGDWVIMQFGHNDQKADKLAIHAPARGAYRDNLLRFINETRARGAHPILATSVARRKWDEAGAALVPTHGDYPAVVRELAAETGAPLLEMEKLTTELERSFGVEGSKRLHLWFEPDTLAAAPKGLRDDTHYSELGARRVAALAADEIRRLDLPLAKWIVTPDVVVSADGDGDYTSLQEAIAKAPMRTGADDPRWVIRVKPGTYRERIYVQRERGRILVRGDDPLTTTVAFDLHAGVVGPDGKPIGTFATPTVQIDGDGMIWEDITLANTAGPVGQALALRADGDRLVFRRCRFLGWQDTVLVNRGRHYFEDCHIEGHVDFIFGAAIAFFARCHIHCLRDGYITAASTPEGAAHGYVFADCRVTTGEEVKKGVYLGRPWRNFARTVFLRTELAGNIRPEGWHNWNKPEAEQTTFYAEFASTGPGASPATRVPWAKTLTAGEADALTPDAVLAGPDGWQPSAR